MQVTDHNPYNRNQRTIKPKLLPAVESESQQLIRNGIIEPPYN